MRRVFLPTGTRSNGCGFVRGQQERGARGVGAETRADKGHVQEDSAAEDAPQMGMKSRWLVDDEEEARPAANGKVSLFRFIFHVPKISVAALTECSWH